MREPVSTPPRPNDAAGIVGPTQRPYRGDSGIMWVPREPQSVPMPQARPAQDPNLYMTPGDPYFKNFRDTPEYEQGIQDDRKYVIVDDPAQGRVYKVEVATGRVIWSRWSV